MSTRAEYPLPTASGCQAPQTSDNRRSRKSGFSLRSSHSRKSSGLTTKIPLNETHEEKEARRLQTKADPSMAITEEQPSAVASGLQTTLAPIRAIQHRDKYGNPIAEPDRSNPTRSRWERPLETIRSFEAAVDGSYSRRSYMRSEINGSRRCSYTNDPTAEAKARSRLNSQYGPPQLSTNCYNSFEKPVPNNSYHPVPARYSRSEFNNGHSIYTVPDVQESYETVNSASPSGSSADQNYSTDPSSESSSIDKIACMSRKDPCENYSIISGYDTAVQRQSILALQSQQTPRQFNQSPQASPDLNSKESPRILIKLDSSNDSSTNVSNDTRPPSRTHSVKLRSWLGKRFSRTS